MTHYVYFQLVYILHSRCRMNVFWLSSTLFDKCDCVFCGAQQGARLCFWAKSGPAWFRSVIETDKCCIGWVKWGGLVALNVVSGNWSNELNMFNATVGYLKKWRSRIFFRPKPCFLEKTFLFSSFSDSENGELPLVTQYLCFFFSHLHLNTAVRWLIKSSHNSVPNPSTTLRYTIKK